ncbi:hypothetical protein ABZ412_10925 [Nocardia sp. NPDC005746]|uniref:hypothetical protein n=1 Tax=Nocardia sp. NPDC005746 TaxID=3157062 RepID=UPI0033C102CF
MLRNKFGILTLAAASMVGSVVAVASPAAEALPGVNWCSWDWMPFSSPTVLPPQIIGEGTVKCTEPPATHVVTLSLEYKDGDNWVVGSMTDPIATIPNPDVHYRVSAACYNGTWRMTARISGTGKQGDFNYTEHSDPPKTVATCENRK